MCVCHVVSECAVDGCLHDYIQSGHSVVSLHVLKCFRAHSCVKCAHIYDKVKAKCRLLDLMICSLFLFSILHWISKKNLI